MTCLNKACPVFQKRDGHNMRRYGFYKTNMGKRRRLQCRRCKRTRGTNTGTAYAGLRCSRNRFDLVAKLSVEGVDISAISRIVQVTWNTAARWQERAAAFASDFLDAKLKRVELQELQADEIRTTLDGKHEETWVFTTLCVWSRLWLSKRIGRRSYKNTKAVLNELFDRVCLKKPVLITTDGFDFYARAIKKLFGAACVYAQVIKRYVTIECTVWIADCYSEATTSLRPPSTSPRIPQTSTRLLSNASISPSDEAVHRFIGRLPVMREDQVA
jgi:transposase-like protein